MSQLLESVWLALASIWANKLRSMLTLLGTGTLRLRSERNQKGDGRVYLIIITATDGAGNIATDCQTVVVPKDQTTKNINSVNAQATAAMNYCITNGAPPPGYFVIGDGPIVRSKQ